MFAKCKKCLSTRRGLRLALTLLFIILVIYFAAPDVFELFELQLLDLRMRLRGAKDPGENVKLILVDTSSRMQYGLGNEFREKLAEVLDDVCREGAQVVGLDLFFVGDTGEEPNEPQQILSEAIDRCGNVVMGYNWLFDANSRRLGFAEAVGRRRLLDATRSPEEPGFTPELIPQKARVADPVITRHAAAVGYFSVITDPYHHARKIPAAISYNDSLYFPFSLALVRTYLKKKEFQLESGGKKQDLIIPKIGNIKLNPDPTGHLWLNYYGTTDAFESIRFDDAVQNGIPEGFAKGAIILLGVSGDDSGDLFSTSYDPDLPGVVLHATAVANALSNRFLARDMVVRAIEISIMVISAIIMGLLIPRFPPTIAIFLGPLLTLLLLILSEQLLSHAGMWLQLINPLLLILLLHLLLLSARMRAAEQTAARVD